MAAPKRTTRAQPKGGARRPSTRTEPSTPTDPPADAEPKANVADVPPPAPGEPDPRDERIAELERQVEQQKALVDSGLGQQVPEATKTDKAIAKLLDDRDHLRNCPSVDGTQPPRVEMYGATVPADPKAGREARPCTVVRCITCGGTVRLDEPVSAVQARL